MHALSSLFLVLLTLTTITAQCPAQTKITNTTADRTVPQGQQQITLSLFINHTLVEQPASGRLKDAIISVVNNGVQCTDIVILGLRGEFGDGITWGSVADFVINSASISAVQSAYDGSLTPLPPASNAMTSAVRTKFPGNGNAVTAIPTSALSKFWINAQVYKTRQTANGTIIVIGQDNSNGTGIAAQPCVVSDWQQCDGCAKDKTQIVTRTIVKPAVGGGSCPPTQMLVYCNRKCLTDWQIGLIALACFLFLVFICICLYCVCVRRRPTDTGRARAEQKQKELEMPPTAAAVDEKINVDVVDPVRPSTAGLDEPDFHRASSETGTGPRPTATFHDDDEPAETKPTPAPQEEAKSAEPEPVVASPPAGAPRANVVRVHL